MLKKLLEFREATIAENGIVMCLYDQVITENDREIGRSLHRKSFSPGDDVSAEHDRVKALAAALWTPDVVAGWKAQLEFQASDAAFKTPLSVMREARKERDKAAGRVQASGGAKA